MAAVDVEPVVTDIAAQAEPIMALGLAVLLVFVTLKAFRWVRAVLNESSGQDWGDTFDDTTYTDDDYKRDSGG